MVYSAKFYIGFSDVNPDLGISNSSILRLFENACCMQGEAVGDGFKDTPGRWFVTAYRVAVSDRPKYNDTVTVSTWSREARGVSASREFEMRDGDGRLLVKALSNWARMNTETGRLERMSPEAFERYESEPERTNFGELWLPKLRSASEGISEQAFTVGKNLADPNRHMNNVRYLDLAAEMLPGENEPNEFEITYRKAYALGESGILSCGEDAESRTVAFLSEDRSETHAIAKFYK